MQTHRGWLLILDNADDLALVPAFLPQGCCKVGVASPQRLLALVRGQWRIENSLHYRRDMTMREDHSQLRMGHAPHLLAILNNTVVGLVARQGRANLAEARRKFAYQVERAFSSPAACERGLRGKRLCNSPAFFFPPLQSSEMCDILVRFFPVASMFLAFYKRPMPKYPGEMCYV